MKKITTMVIICLFCFSNIVYAENNLNNIEPNKKEIILQTIQECIDGLSDEARALFKVDSNASAYSTSSPPLILPYLSFDSIEYSTFAEFYAKTYAEENPMYYAINSTNRFQLMYENNQYTIVDFSTGGDSYYGLYNELNQAFDNQNLPAYLIGCGTYNFVFMTDGEQYLLKPFIWTGTGGMLNGSETPIITGDAWLTWYKTYLAQWEPYQDDPANMPLGGGFGDTAATENSNNTSYWIWFVIAGVTGGLMLLLHLLNKRQLKKENQQ